MNLCTLLLVLFTVDVSHSAVLKQKSHHSPASIDPVVAWRLADILKPRQRDSLFIVNPQIEKIAEKGSSIQIDVRLYGAKTQIFLQVAADGTVNGTSECTSRHAKLQLQSMEKGHLRIKGIEAGRYVAMNENGTVYSTTSPNDETIFRETMQSTSFHTFASAKYYRTTLYDTFISIGRNGKARSGATTNSSQNKVKFLIITADSC